MNIVSEPAGEKTPGFGSDSLLDSFPHELFIGGKWIPSSSGERFSVTDPSSEEIIATVANATIADALHAIEAADSAASQWEHTPPRERSEILRRAFELIHKDCDVLAELIVRENGKSLSDAQGEIAYAAEFFRWFAEEAVRAQGSITKSPSGDKRILVEYQPIGVSLLITPWNFPAAMITRKIGPALAAGCTAIIKPASETPLTALALGWILDKAGLPPGVVNILPTENASEVVDFLLHDKHIKKLSFTGSTQVGRILLREASDRIVNCSMELGGNAPFIVFADADIASAVEGAMVAKMRNGGEACTAANRFFVERSVANEFTSRFVDAMKALRVGPGIEPESDLGPLLSEPQRNKVAQLVDDCIKKGASLSLGGQKLEGKGYFFEPTVISNIPFDADLLSEEIFGPVAPIIVFDDEEQVIQAANDTEYGLVSYLYSGDLSRALRVSQRLESGMVAINRGLVSDPAAPFGGTKQSGLGREGGHDGLLEFLEAKYIAVDW